MFVDFGWILIDIQWFLMDFGWILIDFTWKLMDFGWIFEGIWMDIEWLFECSFPFIQCVPKTWPLGSFHLSSYAWVRKHPLGLLRGL